MKILQRWKQTAVHNKALVFTGALVAFGTLFYAGAAILQIWIMRSSAKNQSEQAERLIAKIEQIADASNKSLAATLEQFHLDQRAWVGTTRDQVDLAAGQPVVFRMEIKNVGKTPALRLQAHTAIAYLNAGEPPPSKFFAWEAGEEQLLQPNQENDLAAEFKELVISQPFLDEIQSGKHWLWLRTEIRYDDVFHAHHHAVICGTVNPKDMKSLRACPPGYQSAD